MNAEYWHTGKITSLDALDTAVYSTSTPGEHDSMLLAAIDFQNKVTQLIREAVVIQQWDNKNRV